MIKGPVVIKSKYPSEKRSPFDSAPKISPLINSDLENVTSQSGGKDNPSGLRISTVKKNGKSASKDMKLDLIDIHSQGSRPQSSQSKPSV